VKIGPVDPEIALLN